ncbi:MAG TPA: DUF2914 domain-containing protein [Vicinamibacterales bacterium]
MTEVVDPASLLDAAQKATAAGDFPAAERLLREAAALQESTLGAEHEDLASTLNNLAFVCERTNNLADAERYYRRAHAIAVASLGPRHPFVATSIKNLVDFCAAHDIPIWKPPAAAVDVEPTHSNEEVTPEPEISELEIDHAEADRDWDVDVPPQPVPVGSWRAPRAIAVAAIGLVVIVALGFTMRSTSSSTSNSPVPARTPPVETSPPVAVEAKPDTTPAAPLEPSAPVAPPAPRARGERPAPRATHVTPQPVTVLNARLCSALVRRGTPDWQCSSSGAELRPGRYSFYTRLLTSAYTTVEHRWYHDGRVHQVMRLRISANPSGGYRTYSSNTISVERAGDWKVELRAADGTLLHEERFVVR